MHLPVQTKNEEVCSLGVENSQNTTDKNPKHKHPLSYLTYTHKSTTYLFVEAMEWSRFNLIMFINKVKYK